MYNAGRRPKRCIGSVTRIFNEFFSLFFSVLFCSVLFFSLLFFSSIFNIKWKETFFLFEIATERQYTVVLLVLEEKEEETAE